MTKPGHLTRRHLLASSASLFALTASSSAGAGLALKVRPIRTSYDFIIIGAGPGGGPLAANLAKAGYDVALLDAGFDPLGPEAAALSPAVGQIYQTPGFFGGSEEHPVMSWDYYIDSYDDVEQMRRNDKYVEGKGILYPRGFGLGGSLSHNALIFTYPHDRDFDDIVALTGDESWSSARMRSFYERLEACGYCRADQANGKPEALTETGHGAGGYIPVNYNDPMTYRLFPAIRDIAHAGVEGELAGDMNGKDTAAGATGAFYMPQNASGNRRVGVREMLQAANALYPDRLHILQNSLVSRILTSRRGGALIATGVELHRGGGMSYRAGKLSSTSPAGERVVLSARREVIVAAGAFNTPQLLKLSGIGPRAELETLGIDVVTDLPGVGANLQDRYESPLIYELKTPLRFWDRCAPFTEADPCQTALATGQWPETPSTFHGPYAGNSIFTSRILKTSLSDGLPDVVTAGVPFYFKGYYPGFSSRPPSPHWTWNVLKVHTRNRAGEVLLRSKDPRDPPIVKFRYFADGDTDLRAEIEALREMRESMKDPKAQQHIVREVLPGEQVTSDEDLGTYIRNIAWGHHASSTAAIGADDDPMAVLDSRFRVRGFANLRVVDASVFPRTPGFFPAAAILMISEKASDVILEDSNAP